MKFSFKINPYNAVMHVTAEYKKEEIGQNFFYLNRDFVIEHCGIDGTKYDINNAVELVKFADWEYQVNKYTLPPFSRGLVLEYTGRLTGETGSYPYVRETISPEFTFIREETYCYPQFFNHETGGTALFDFLTANVDLDITVEVPEEFTVVSNIETIKSREADGIIRHIFKTFNNSFAFAIAKYIFKPLSFGNFYLLDDMNCKELESTMAKAHKFMNEHFGVRHISSDVNFAAIPDGFGSFARQKTVFIEEKSLKSTRAMNGIIHEFIHLGWNVPCDNETQRIRFFDEAFTCYFEMRVMEHLLGDNYRLAEYIDAYKQQLAYFDGDIPIIDFGKHEYGDLSYTIGAICLHKLSEFVGVDIFDKATKAFLQKYKDTPVNMDIFCDEYMILCGKPGLERFFAEWIYAADGPKAFIKTCARSVEENN